MKKDGTLRALIPQFTMVVLRCGRSRFLALPCSLGFRRTSSATGGVRLRPQTPAKGRNAPWNPKHSDIVAVGEDTTELVWPQVHIFLDSFAFDKHGHLSLNNVHIFSVYSYPLPAPQGKRQ